MFYFLANLVGHWTINYTPGKKTNRVFPRGIIAKVSMTHISEGGTSLTPLQGCSKGQKSGGAGSNAARRRCPAGPSDLPKSGEAAAPPAPTLAASLH